MNNPVSFRLPPDTPESVIEYLTELKGREGRGYSRRIASIFINGVNEEINSTGEKLVINLPGELTKEQREWLNNPMTKKMLGQWIFQLLNESNKPISMGIVEVKEDKADEVKVSAYHTNLANSFFDDDE